MKKKRSWKASLNTMLITLEREWGREPLCSTSQDIYCYCWNAICCLLNDYSKVKEPGSMGRNNHITLWGNKK